jgi:putative two-component system response regulator
MRLRHHEDYASYLSTACIERLYQSAPLHDIGKVGIPDRVLLKTGRYTQEEFDLMKRHTTLGSSAIARAEEWVGADLEFLSIAKEIASGHHERWDGSGYPAGLSGTAIPISARLMAVADVYDALVSRRVYKDAMDHDRAMDLIGASGGSHFDPEMAKAFLAIGDEIRDIAGTFAERDSDLFQKSLNRTEASGLPS